jgi:hypothetical protein
MTRSSEKGLSLVEATIILMVLATLTAVIAPAAGVYINDARSVRAQDDVAAIGAGILNLLRDTGSRCLRLAGTTECTVGNRVDLLMSAGSQARALDVANVTLVDSDAVAGAPASLNWLNTTTPASAPQAGNRSTVDEHLVRNNLGTPYAAATFTSSGGPRMKLGWRGAYLNGPVGPDPWGYMYQVNTVFLTVGSNALDGALNHSQEGLREAGWNRDVLVLSPGSNGVISTSFGGAAATDGVAATGDDIVYVLRGAS